MRRALATAGLLSAVTLGALGVTAAPALAEGATSTAAGAVYANTNLDPDDDGKDDTGKWGLIGLSGLLGLFGYKKYRDHRAATTDRTTTTRTTRDDNPGSTGSTRV